MLVAGLLPTGLFTVPVVASGMPPVADSDVAFTTQDIAVDIFLSASDPEFDTLTYSIVTGPDHGTISGASCVSAGQCTYAPAAGYAGPDAFTWKVNDGTADSNVATIDITVTAIAFQKIVSAGPLTRVQVGNELNCAVDHASDTSPEFFGDTACAALIATGGTLFGPAAIPAGGGANPRTTYTLVSQSGVTGSGTVGDPYRIVTVVDLGTTGLRASETDTYVVGQEAYRTDVAIHNSGAGSVDAVLYRAGDCYLQNSDDGFGAVDAATGAVSCVGSVDNGMGVVVPSDRIEQWYPLSPGSSYYHASFSQVWAWIGSQMPFPDTCRCADFIDNGAGLSWSLTIPAGQTLTRSHLTVFSPVGIQPLTTTKTAASPSTAAGGANSYTITIANPNDVVAGLTAITDTLPASFGYTAGTTTGATTTDPASMAQTLTWSGPFSVPANGTLTLTFGVTVSNTAGIYTNDAGATGTAQFIVLSSGPTASVTVTAGPPPNPPPTSDAGGPYTGTEGSPISLDGTVTNEPGTDTVTQTWSYVVDSGDAGMTCAFGDASLVDTTITCTDDGTVTVTLTVNDGVNTPATTDTATVTIGNANPTVDITAPTEAGSFLTGVTVNVSATITDPGSNDTHTCSIDWGDGTITVGVVAAGLCTGSHAYSTAGGKTITVTITDDDGGVGTDTVGITVTAPVNPAPTSDAGGPYTGTEGSPISLDGTVTNEPGTDTVTQTWSYVVDSGDAGMTCTFGDASLVDTTITCTDDGSVTVTLTVSDGVNTPATTDTASVTLANANPTVSITSPADLATVNVGATVNLTANRGDPGSNDIATSTCSIDWGDGTPITVGTLTATTCTGSHVYAAIGVYTVRVTITDDDTGSAFDEIMLVVVEPGSKVTGGGWVTVPGEGKLRFGLVAQPDGAAAEGEIQVRWGKHRFHGKTVTNLVANKPNASWSGAGRYDGTDGYTYEVRIVDNGNGGGKNKTPDTFAITIRDSGGTIVFSTGPLPLKGGNLKIH